MEVDLKNLTEGSLLKHLLNLAIPTIGGMIAFSIFNITDTYFVGKLGTNALAAMGFTFPVVMVAGAVSVGVSTGAASLLSRAYGKKDNEEMRRIATNGILLAMVIVAVFTPLGLLTMDSLFTLLGAESDILPMIKSYMTIWYGCVVVVMMPPVCDGAMRAVGDTIRPFKVMLICAILNIILDPIFIFGWLGVPAMGIKGAAIATIISRFIGMLASLYYNHYHHNLIDWKVPKLDELLSSWSGIIRIAVPSIGVTLLPQLIRIALTAFSATIGGTVYVAAVAVGTRIEGFALVISMAIGSSIVPLIGQNYGAGELLRVREIQRLISKSAIIIGIGMFATMSFASEPLIKLFTTNPELIEISKLYLIVVTLGSAGLNLYNFNSHSLNAIGLSKESLLINVLGTVALILPLMFIGAQYSFFGMLLGLVAGQLIVGLCSNYYVKNIFKFKHLETSEKTLLYKL